MSKDFEGWSPAIKRSTARSFHALGVRSAASMGTAGAAEFVRRALGGALPFVKRVKARLIQDIFNPGVKISDTSFTEHIDYLRLSKPFAIAQSATPSAGLDVFQSET